MIELNNLTFCYPNHHNAVFEDFSLHFDEGHIYGLLGTNGAGKSTLLYIMAGLLTPDKGGAWLDNKVVRDRKPSVMREIFLVPDEFELPSVTLLQYIDDNAVFYPRFSREDLDAYLASFGMTVDVSLGGLSLGQRKKIFMSFAMATHTKILLMDEPTNGLDIVGKRQLREFLGKGIAPDRTFIVSTHQVKDIEAVLDHILLIDRNELLCNCSASQIYEQQALSGELTDDHINLEVFFEKAVKGKEAHHD